jgi:hypothetical protein
MELDELKAMWAQYDTKLTENLRLNEELLKKMNLDKSKQEMQIPLNYEIASVLINVLFLLFFGISTFNFASELKFLLPGLVATLLSVWWLLASLRKVNILMKIDYFNSPVIELQKSINTVKQKALLFRKIEFYLLPIYAVAFAPIFVKVIYNIDIYNESKLYITGLISSLILYYPLAIWYYKIIYDKKLKATSDFLNELNRFEKE